MPRGAHHFSEPLACGVAAAQARHAQSLAAFVVPELTSYVVQRADGVWVAFQHKPEVGLGIAHHPLEGDGHIATHAVPTSIWTGVLFRRQV